MVKTRDKNMIATESSTGHPMTFVVAKDKLSGIFTYIRESHDDWGDSVWCMCARVVVDQRHMSLYVKHALFSVRDPTSTFDGSIDSDADYMLHCPDVFTQFRDRFFGPGWTVHMCTDVDNLVARLYNSMVQEDDQGQVSKDIHMEVAKYLASSHKDVTQDDLVRAMRHI